MGKRGRHVVASRGLRRVKADRGWHQVFQAVGVSLSDELVASLVADGGWDRDELLAYRAAGWVYCPERGTLLSPVRGTGFGSVQVEAGVGKLPGSC